MHMRAHTQIERDREKESRSYNIFRASTRKRGGVRERDLESDEGHTFAQLDEAFVWESSRNSLDDGCQCGEEQDEWAIPGEGQPCNEEALLSVSHNIVNLTVRISDGLVVTTTVLTV
jgi:hypothetical protein